MRRWVPPLLALPWLIPLSVVHAAAMSPPPPPPPLPPSCSSCNPPPPPTPVSTLPPQADPVAVTIAVQVSPPKVRRNHTLKIGVESGGNDEMTAEITLGRDKPYLLKGKLDMYGATTRQWKVPKSAPLGKGTIKVTVVDHNTPYSTSIQFEVVK